jgi:hypothetical protein
MEAAGYDVHPWEVDIQRDLTEAFIRMSGELLGEGPLEAMRAYHMNSKRHAAVSLLVRVAIESLRQGSELFTDQKVTEREQILLDTKITGLEDLRKIFTDEVRESRE